GALIVTGNGGTCTAADQSGCTGGTIQNKTGGDITDNLQPATISGTTGTGIFLRNTRNVSLTRMHLHDFDNFAILGSTIVNFTMANTVINGVNGNNGNVNEGTMVLYQYTGTGSVTNSVIRGGIEDIVKIVNTTGTLDRITFDTCNIGQMDQGIANGNDAVFIQGQNAAVVRATFQGCTFTDARGDILQFDLTNTATGDLVFTSNTVNNQHPFTATGGGGLVLSGGGSAAAAPTLTYDLDGNSFRGARGDALLIALQTGLGSATGRIENNTFGVAGVDQSGAREASDIEIRTVGRGAQTTVINNNQIRQYGNYGILLEAGDISVSGTTGTVGALNASITNNIIEQPSTFAFTNKNGVHVNLGTTSGDTYQACVDILNNTGNAGGSTDAGIGTDYILRQRQATTMRLPSYGGANNDNAAVVSYIQGRNVGTETVSASNTVPTGGGYTGGAGACTQPPAFAPSAEGANSATISPRVNDNGQLLAELTGIEPLWMRYFDASGQTSNSMSVTEARPQSASSAASGTVLSRNFRQLARPTFTAFAAPMNTFSVSRLSNWITPTVSAAENSGAGVQSAANSRSVSPSNASPNGVTPRAAATSLARTAMAGETIGPINVGTLPAGKSFTVRFNAQISSSYAFPSISNQASVSGSGFGPILSNNQTTDVIQPPFFAKSFSPPNIATNGTATLQFALLNTNNSQSLSQVTFTDVLPVG
ncbi:MAG TPA: hypothetical protein VGB07_22475, partial [Blastocatellia bacterium]